MRGDKLLLMAAVLEGWQRSEDSLVFGEDQRVSAYLVNIATKNQFYADAWSCASPPGRRGCAT